MIESLAAADGATDACPSRPNLDRFRVQLDDAVLSRRSPVTTTLLAVDDSVTMRKVLEITFAGENFKTILASNAQEALNLAKSERPTLVLLDHTLPDMSGYDLCRELKAVAPSMAVLVMSSKQTPYDKARGTATGVDDFMDKPFDTQKLLDKVAQVLSQPRAAAASVPQRAAPRSRAPVAAAPVRKRGRARRRLSYGTPAPTAARAESPRRPAPASLSRTLAGRTPHPRRVRRCRGSPLLQRRASRGRRATR